MLWIVYGASLMHAYCSDTPNLIAVILYRARLMHVEPMLSVCIQNQFDGCCRVY